MGLMGTTPNVKAWLVLERETVIEKTSGGEGYVEKVRPAYQKREACQTYKCA